MPDENAARSQLQCFRGVPILKDPPHTHRSSVALRTARISSLWFFHRCADYSMVSSGRNMASSDCPRQMLASARFLGG